MLKRTIKILTTFCLAAAGLALAFPVAAQEPSPAPRPSGPVPKVAFATTEVDAGQVLRGKPAEAAFTVRNTGTDVLKILSVKPG